MEEDITRQKEFLNEYNDLCKKYNLELKPAIGFKQQIDASFTLTAQLTIVELIENNRI